jgi:hypothetical protein
MKLLCLSGRFGYAVIDDSAATIASRLSKPAGGKHTAAVTKVMGETGYLLSDDHAEVDVLLDDALDKLCGADLLRAFDALDLFWARLAVHIRAEHLYLFPAALKVCESEAVSGIPEILERLRGDHDLFMHELAEAIKSMRAVTSESEPDVRLDVVQRLETLKVRLVEHNAIEEERIYGLRSFLSPGDQRVLARSLAKELDNLPPRIAKRR